MSGKKQSDPKVHGRYSCEIYGTEFDTSGKKRTNKYDAHHDVVTVKDHGSKYILL